MKSGQSERRQRVLDFLKHQLEVGKKPEKVNGKTATKLVDLTPADRKRIEYDIKVLETKLKGG
jgi:hypothetical protein